MHSARLLEAIRIRGGPSPLVCRTLICCFARIENSGVIEYQCLILERAIDEIFRRLSHFDFVAPKSLQVVIHT